MRARLAVRRSASHVVYHSTVIEGIDRAELAKSG